MKMKGIPQNPENPSKSLQDFDKLMANFVYTGGRGRKPKLSKQDGCFSPPHFSSQPNKSEEEEKGKVFDEIPQPKPKPKPKPKNKGKAQKKKRYVSPYFPVPTPAADEEVIVMPRNLKRKAGKRSLSWSEIILRGLKIQNGDKKRKPAPPLSASEKLNEAYRRIIDIHNNPWKPPKSYYNLIQDDYVSDPWKVLVICMLLNRTTAVQAGRVLSNLFRLCPDAKTTVGVDTVTIQSVIQTLGFHAKRAEMIKRFSMEYLGENWTHVTQLHGVGKYAADAYAIFCTGKWESVKPADHMLNAYWKELHWLRYMGKLPGNLVPGDSAAQI